MSSGCIAGLLLTEVPASVRNPATILPGLSNVLEEVWLRTERIGMLLQRVMNETVQQKRFDFLVYLLLEDENHWLRVNASSAHTIRRNPWQTLRYQPDCSVCPGQYA